MAVTSLCCDQNGDRVSKNDESCHTCSMRLKGVLVKFEKYGTLSMYHQFNWPRAEVVDFGNWYSFDLLELKLIATNHLHFVFVYEFLSGCLHKWKKQSWVKNEVLSEGWALLINL